MNKDWCMYCDSNEEYLIKEETCHCHVLDLDFDISLKHAYCKKCGHEIFPHELWVNHDLIVYDEYRKRKGLLTSQEIKGIRKKRNLSQVELARLIRCGEKNIARYETGTIQDRSFDLLIRLVGDDNIYPLLKKLVSNEKKTSLKHLKTTHK